ncbi:MAG: hypothetical protein IJV91_03550 [Kiritimatiellae bacterium]|nr:hypothetical protein [Kiritimatiellia bacterium]
MGYMKELATVGDAIAEYNAAVWRRLGMESWPVGDIPAQARYYGEFMAHVRENSGDYFNRPWNERETIRNYLSDVYNDHSAARALSVLC